MKITLFILLVLTTQTLAKNTDDLFSTAKKKIQQGQLVEASVLLTELLSHRPEHENAWYQRGLSFKGMGQTNRAIEDFKQAVDLKITNLDAYLQLIEHYKSNHQHMAILIITDQIIANLPAQAAGAYKDKAEAYEALQEPRLAIKSYQRLLDCLDENNVDLRSFRDQVLGKVTQLKNQLKE